VVARHPPTPYFGVAPLEGREVVRDYPPPKDGSHPQTLYFLFFFFRKNKIKNKTFAFLVFNYLIILFILIEK
jgi:hypothetical protein